MDGQTIKQVIFDTITPANWRRAFLIEGKELFNIPGFFAVRTTSEHISPDRLYARYNTGNEEFYDMNTDPFQLVSTHVELTVEQRSLIDGLLDALKACAGTTCHDLEWHQ